MPRPPRRDYEGAWHHVMNRGARRDPLFKLDEHCSLFLTTLKEVQPRFGLEIHAYALMPNHYHLLVRSVRGNLSRVMRHLGAEFTQDLNRLYGWDGPLFRGRFRNQLIRNEQHLLTVAAYIHLNPLKAGLARRLDERCWTSHRAYLGLEVPPEWLTRGTILGLAGGGDSFGQFVRDIRIGRRTWPEAFDAESGWWRYSDEKQQPWSHHRHADSSDPEIPAPLQLEEALGRVAEVAATDRTEVTRAAVGRGANPARRFAVWALSQSTNLTHTQIGAALGMSSAQVGAVLHRLRRPRPPIAEWIVRWSEMRAKV